MSAEPISQFVHFLDAQQEAAWRAMREDHADAALHDEWQRGFDQRGVASEKQTRTKKLWQRGELEAKRRYVQAIAAVASIPPNLAKRWLKRLDRMLQTHKRLMSYCVLAADRREQVDEDLVQDSRELRAQSRSELYALHDAAAPENGDVRLEHAGGPPALAGKPRSKRGTISQRVLETLSRNPQSSSWPQREWAEVLGCAPSAIAKAAAWKTVKAARAMAKVDRLDRQHNRTPK